MFSGRHWNFIVSRRLVILLLHVGMALAHACSTIGAPYVGSVTIVNPNSITQSAGTEILGDGGGTGEFTYKGGGNAVDAAVATSLAACIVSPAACGLGGYGGHMMIYKSGWDGAQKLVTCIDFNTAAGSLAASNMFATNLNPVTGARAGSRPGPHERGWKAAGVPGTFSGLYMAQTNHGRKMDGTNYFPFADILKTSLARVARGQVSGNAYYSLTSVSNLLMDLYTNSPGYTNISGQPNPNSVNDPHAVFYSGGIAVDIAAAMQANGGLVTYADLTNYRAREVTPYSRHFAYPGGTPATVYVAPPGSSGVSVLQQLAIIDALGWTNGPNGTWNSAKYWHSRAEAARLMWKDHFQWVGDPWSGVVPPDIMGNGSTNLGDQLLAHATNGYPLECPWDPTQVLLTNSLAQLISNAVDQGTNVQISVDWDDIRYGTCHISTSDKWGNCVAVTLSAGGSYGAQVAVTNRALIMGQGMALFDLRPGWPDSIAPGKRPVNNMSPAIAVPDNPVSPASGVVGGRPPLAMGAAGGSTIQNNMVSRLLSFLMEPPSSPVNTPSISMYNFEGNKTIYMRTSYPTGVQSYLNSVGFTAPGGPPSIGVLSFTQGWVPPLMASQPTSTNITSGGTAKLSVSATGLPLFYQWYRDGIVLTNGATVSGAQTPSLTVTSITKGSAFHVVVTNTAASVTSSPVAVTITGAPVITMQPSNVSSFPGAPATFSVVAEGAPPLAYQWRRNGVPLANTENLSGTTAPELHIASVSSAELGNYSVVITNSAGNVTSAVAALTISQTNATPELILYEPFDYPNVGGPVSSNTPANWTYGGGGANDLSLVDEDLSYPGLAASIGHSVTNGGAGLGVRRLLGTNISKGKLYFSALFRMNDLGYGAWSGVSSMAGGLTATDNTSFRLQVLVKSNSPNGYVIGTQKSGSGAVATFETNERHAGDTIFVVGKYDFTVTPNAVTLWVNPSWISFGGPEPTSGFITSTGGPDGLVIDRFNMRQNVASGSSSVPAAMQWDELRFGFSWASVTPSAPFYGPPVLTAIRETGDGTFEFIYTNTGSQSYEVFASTNLLQWDYIGGAQEISTNTFQFIDFDAINLDRRFYRLQSP